jgi:hypothetical protein
VRLDDKGGRQEQEGRVQQHSAATRWLVVRWRVRQVEQTECRQMTAKLRYKVDTRSSSCICVPCIAQVQGAAACCHAAQLSPTVLPNQQHAPAVAPAAHM